MHTSAQNDINQNALFLRVSRYFNRNLRRHFFLIRRSRLRAADICPRCSGPCFPRRNSLASGESGARLRPELPRCCRTISARPSYSFTGPWISITCAVTGARPRCVSDREKNHHGEWTHQRILAEIEGSDSPTGVLYTNDLAADALVFAYVMARFSNGYASAAATCANARQQRQVHEGPPNLLRTG